MRVLEDGERRRANVAERDLKRVMGGLLVQDRDMGLEDRTEMEVVSDRKPSEAEWGEMLFAWKVCKHVRSNAIVFSNDLASVGIGAGPDEPRGLRAAGDREGPRRRLLAARRGAGLGRVLPVLRRPAARGRGGVTAIIQPGGSVRDHEVVEAADAAGISMVFTHRRHFRH